MSLRSSAETFGLPTQLRDRQRQYDRNPARCQRMIVSGLTIAMAPRGCRETSDTAKQQKSIGIVQLRSLRRPSAKHVDLLAKNQQFCFQRCSRLEERSQDAENQFEQIRHRAVSLPRLILADMSNRIFFVESNFRYTQVVRAVRRRGETTLSRNGQAEIKGVRQTKHQTDDCRPTSRRRSLGSYRSNIGRAVSASVCRHMAP